MLVLPILLLAVALAVSMFASKRFQQGLDLGRKVTPPGAQTAGEVAREFLDANEAGDVKIVEHNALVSDYYDPKRRVLFLHRQVMQGTDAASWAQALHEAAHATQRGPDAGALRWRLGNIRLARYAPALIGFAALLFVFLKRLQPRHAIFLCGVAFFLIVVANAMSMAVEYNASQRAQAWLERKLRRHRDALDVFEKVLPRVAWRDTGALLKSPLYLLFGMLPVGGAMRPR